MEDPRLANIRAAYGRRTELADLYDPLLTPNVRMRLERTRIQAALIRRWLGPNRLADMDVLEIGCGTGDNILSLIALGADPHRIVGNELLDERLEIAARRLPSAVRLHLGDGAQLPDSYGSFDLIMQFVVFSSILDDPLLTTLASRIWNMLRPGGIILSYDMAVGNPFNPDVRGIPPWKLKMLFPGGELTARSLTVAPPLARIVSDKLYPLLAAMPFLRTHCLCAIRKSR